MLQGGAIIRQARRTAERVGYDPDTGLHLPEPPADQQREPVILEDCKQLCTIHSFRQLDCN